MSAPYLFDRQWQLTLLPKGATIASVYTSRPERGAPLQMQFDVKRTLHSTSNKATFRLFNLTASQRHVFDVGTRVILNCGYGDNWQDYVSRVYLGVCEKKTVSQEGGDIVVSLECGDAELLLQQCAVNVAVNQPTSLAAVLRILCRQLNVTIGSELSLVKTSTFQRLPAVTISRFVFTGPARMAFDALLKHRGIQWSLQNGELLVQANQGIVRVRATRLTRDTGLLERPAVSEQGITCRALIQASLEPGAAMQIVSTEPGASGNYRIVEAAYKGDTNGGDWAVEITGEPLANLLAPYVQKSSQDEPTAAIDNETDPEDLEAAL